MTRTSALRVVRASAAYDLVVTVVFALPWTAVLALDALVRLHGALDLAGALPDPTDPFTLLFANLTGSVVTVWALVRLWRPNLGLGAADSVARALFSLAMAAALTSGASDVVVLFLVPEIAWGLVQAISVHAARSA